MDPPALKRACSDTLSTSASKTPRTSRIISMVGSYITLKILKDRTDGKIVELTIAEPAEEPTKPVSISDIENIIDQVYFQDNTMVFETLLSCRHIVVIIYPPDTGKTTMAILLEAFLSSTDLPDKVNRFFENCEFATQCPDKYEKFRKSANVAYINFEAIEGRNKDDFQKSLIEIMLNAFKKYFNENVFEKAQGLMSTPGSVYVSLQKFIRELTMKDRTKTKTYLLLDSCDKVYDTIAQLGAESWQICKRFTQFLSTSYSNTFADDVVTICFGVSGYFATQLSGMACFYDIDEEKSIVGKYFSYSTNTINKVIEKYDLDATDTLEKCLKVAKFKFNGNSFLNPAICVSFLRSLYLKRNHFHVNIAPRPLWLSCIFTQEDKDSLSEVLRGPCEKEFLLYVRMSHIIEEMYNERTPDGKLFYSMFIFGGFLSCVKCADEGKYQLDVANETTRCLLDYCLRDISKFTN